MEVKAGRFAFRTESASSERLDRKDEGFAIGCSISLVLVDVCSMTLRVPFRLRLIRRRLIGARFAPRKESVPTATVLVEPGDENDRLALGALLCWRGKSKF